MMSQGYNIPDLPEGGLHRDELIIQRSRFLVSLAHTPCQITAKAFIQRIQTTFPDATHNCWAFAAGPPGDTAQVGYSDDGEPHGTAGRPMLTVLLHGGVGEVTAVVTRYFGGIKLGTGGLVRAYQQLVKLGLETLPVREHRQLMAMELVIDYSHVTPILRLLPQFFATVTHEAFAADVTYVVTLPEDQGEAFARAVTECTAGAVLMHAVTTSATHGA